MRSPKSPETYVEFESVAGIRKGFGLSSNPLNRFCSDSNNALVKLLQVDDMLDMASHFLCSETTVGARSDTNASLASIIIVALYAGSSVLTTSIKIFSSRFVRMQTSSLCSVRRTFNLVWSSFESASNWMNVLFQRVLFVRGIVFLNTTKNASANKPLVCSIFERRDALERTGDMNFALFKPSHTTNCREWMPQDKRSFLMPSKFDKMLSTISSLSGSSPSTSAVLSSTMVWLGPLWITAVSRSGSSSSVSSTCAPSSSIQAMSILNSSCESLSSGNNSAMHLKALSMFAALSVTM